jgi:hypothetical protein
LRCSALTLAKWRQRGYGPKWKRIGPQRIGYLAVGRKSTVGVSGNL